MSQNHPSPFAGHGTGADLHLLDWNRMAWCSLPTTMSFTENAKDVIRGFDNRKYNKRLSESNFVSRIVAKPTATGPG